MGLQGPLLVSLGGLGGSGILTELLQTGLGIGQGVLLCLIVQPWHGLLDPLNQLCGSVCVCGGGRLEEGGGGWGVRRREGKGREERRVGEGEGGAENRGWEGEKRGEVKVTELHTSCMELHFLLPIPSCNGIYSFWKTAYTDTHTLTTI